MTQPVPPPIPLDVANAPTWCTTCEIHQATASRPVCPVCEDETRHPLAEEASA